MGLSPSAQSSPLFSIGVSRARSDGLLDEWKEGKKGLLVRREVI